MVGRELADEAVALLSTAIGMIMEDHAPQALLIRAPSRHKRMADLRRAGEDISVLAAAAEALLRRRDK